MVQSGGVLLVIVHWSLIEKYRLNIPKHSGHNTTENEYVLTKKIDFIYSGLE